MSEELACTGDFRTLQGAWCTVHNKPQVSCEFDLLTAKLAAAERRASEYKAKLKADHETALKWYRENFELEERNVELAEKLAACEKALRESEAGAALVRLNIIEMLKRQCSEPDICIDAICLQERQRLKAVLLSDAGKALLEERERLRKALKAAQIHMRKHGVTGMDSCIVQALGGE